MILLNQAIILMNEAMVKALRVPYEAPRLGDSLVCILIFEIKQWTKSLLHCYNFICLCCRIRR
jgi:hypothetical protein